MTSPKLAVIATSLPYIDRRSLSQAWFSALHLASDAPRERASHERRFGVLAGVTPATLARRRACAAGANVTVASASRAPRAALATLEIGLRRTLDARTAASARASYHAARSYPPFETSLTLGVGGGRVRLLLRRDGPTLHVVALCGADVAATVRRALARADAHLRARGETVRSSVEIVVGKAAAE